MKRPYTAPGHILVHVAPAAMLAASTLDTLRVYTDSGEGYTPEESLVRQSPSSPVQWDDWD